MQILFRIVYGFRNIFRILTLSFLSFSQAHIIKTDTKDVGGLVYVKTYLNLTFRPNPDSYHSRHL